MLRPNNSPLNCPLGQVHRKADAARAAEKPGRHGPVAALKELTRAHWVGSYNIQPNVVTMNSRFKVREMNSSDELKLSLVYPPAANDAQRRISILNAVRIAVLRYQLGAWILLRGEAGPVGC